MKLRAQLVVANIMTVSLVTIATASFFTYRIQHQMNAQLDAEVAMIREDLEHRASELVGGVAVASERALLMKDFLFLQEIVGGTKEKSPEIVYATIVNDAGMAVVHTNPERAGTLLDTEQDLQVRHADALRTREIRYDGQPVIEAVGPVNVGDKPWGVVRVGMSLQRVNAAIAQQQEDIRVQIRDGVLIALATTAVLALLGVVLATFVANRLTQPLNDLEAAANRIRAGNMQESVTLQGSSDFQTLADTFNGMMHAVQQREAALKEALAEAEEANRLKSEFFANVSHELRTPLNAIINIPRLLLHDLREDTALACEKCNEMFAFEPAAPDEQPPTECPNCGGVLTWKKYTVFTGDPADHRHLNERALRSSKHLLSVVNDVLDFSKLQAGKMQIHAETVTLGDLFDQVTTTMQPLASEKKVDLQVQRLDDSTVLYGDRIKLTQVLLNLVGNAIKFTDPGGHIYVGSKANHHEDNTVKIEVSDTGVGIPNDKLQIIFEPFRQADGSHTRSVGGTGLGLSIASQIVALHGGHIDVQSEVGKGSSFSVVLPASSISETVPATQPTPSWALKDDGTVKQLVVVDDDPIYLEVVTRMLTTAGLKVDAVSVSTQAVDKVRDLRPDLVLIDLMMPSMSGITVLQNLKASEDTKNIPVIVCSAYRANQAIVENMGASWLPKPWDLQGLGYCVASQQTRAAANLVVKMRSQKA